MTVSSCSTAVLHSSVSTYQDMVLTAAATKYFSCPFEATCQNRSQSRHVPPGYSIQPSSLASWPKPRGDGYMKRWKTADDHVDLRSGGSSGDFMSNSMPTSGTGGDPSSSCGWARSFPTER
ncbi:unnamed protein product [Heligmosomoides polygyrus]|uniref:Secreted protein n=1 Tax=Heligmosomoides polygyrus TaxID=6339 RepID=A0A183FSL3_HELPZ|nr:unnamed protein product [Heligmosomoides polygyrus]